MKILHIDQYYEYGGGTGQYVLSVMDILEKMGHPQVMVYSNHTDKTIKKPGRSEYHLPKLTAGFNKTKIRELKNIIDKESPDVIYLHTGHNHYLVEQCVRQRPTIRFIHDPSLCCFTNWKLLPGLSDICTYRLSFSCFSKGCLGFNIKNFIKYIVRLKELRIHKKLKRLIVASQYMKELLVQNGFDSSSIDIISCYVTSPPPASSSLPVKKNETYTIFYAGVIHRIKGVDKMLKALSMVKNDFTAILAGTGEYLEEYKRFAKDLGIKDKVCFLGWVPNEKLMDYYQMADIVLVPSIWIEAFAIVGIEAMSCSKPIIAFDTGGISEWLKDNVNGFLVPRGSSEALAEKIDLLLNDASLREKMGKAGRRLYEKNFTKDIHVDKLINMMHRIKR